MTPSNQNNVQDNPFTKGLLVYLSREQLAVIQAIKIGIGGAGGLGSNVAMMLVRSGFNHLEIIDHDIIEPSNLNRQQYFIDEVGQNKVDVTRKRLRDINPDIQLLTHQTRWTPDIGEKFFTNCDFIIEAFDQAQWKHAFVDYYRDKTKYIVSGNGMAGLTEKQPMQLKIIGNIYMAGDTTTDSAAGHPPMAPRVTMCAAMMAEVVLDLTLGLDVRLSSSQTSLNRG